MMFCVVDLEATCWESDESSDHVADKNEIIEIGMAVCEDNGDIIKTYQTFVKPIINPVLSDFCKRLTKIEQSWIDNAVELTDAIVDMKQWFQLSFGKDISDVVWTSWGDFDKKCLIADLTRHNETYFMGPHFSAKTLYAEDRGIKRCGVPQALRKENLIFIGTHHRAKDDAVNIARIIKSSSLCNKILEQAYI